MIAKFNAVRMWECGSVGVIVSLFDVIFWNIFPEKMNKSAYRIRKYQFLRPEN
jgi:hypothetical protein